MTPAEQREYWRALLDYMKGKSLLLKDREPYKEPWQVIDDWLGYSVRSAARLNAKEHWIHVDLTLDGPKRVERFSNLEKDRWKIQSEVLAAMFEGSDSKYRWRWEERDNPKDGESWIILPRPADPTAKREWQPQHEWLARALVAFRLVFGSRLSDF